MDIDSEKACQDGRKNCAEIIVITSGKGGVGKTTTSAAISLALAIKGFKTVVIDFDIGLRNLDLVMGCERRVIYDLINLINGEVNVNQALVQDKRSKNLYILPASQTRDKDALTETGLKNIIQELKEEFDYIICDSPAGIEKGAQMAMLHADRAIIVANLEISSVRDADRIIGILSSKTLKVREKRGSVSAGLLITRYDLERVVKGDMLSLQDVEEMLSIPLLGVIPESKMILRASNSGVPITAYQNSKASQAYVDTTERLLGNNKPLRFINTEKKLGLLSRLFKGISR